MKKPSLLSLPLVVVSTLALTSACAETTVTILTQAPPGRTAAVDVEEERLTVSRGLAVALDCVEWTETYSGPCRDMEVTLGDDALADVLDVHLDALGNVRGTSGALDAQATLAGPADRASALLAARQAGQTALEVTSAGAPITFTLVVLEPPDTGATDDE